MGKYYLTIDDDDQEMRAANKIYARISKDAPHYRFQRDLISGWMSEEDAKLLAAAPELLEACHQALQAVPTTHGVFETLRNAIAKAEGSNE